MFIFVPKNYPYSKPFTRRVKYIISHIFFPPTFWNTVKTLLTSWWEWNSGEYKSISQSVAWVSAKCHQKAIDNLKFRCFTSTSVALAVLFYNYLKFIEMKASPEFMAIPKSEGKLQNGGHASGLDNKKLWVKMDAEVRNKAIQMSGRLLRPGVLRWHRN